MTILGDKARNNGLKFCSVQREIYLQISKWVYFSYFLSTSVALNMSSLYQLFHDFENFLHVPIWALPILGTHLFSRSNLSYMRPWTCPDICTKLIYDNVYYWYLKKVQLKQSATFLGVVSWIYNYYDDYFPWLPNAPNFFLTKNF